MKRDKKRNLWSERVSSYQASGLSAREWCEQNQISTSTFQYWVQKFRKEVLSHDSNNESTQWLSLEVSDIKSKPSIPDATAGVRINIGSATIELSPGFDLNTLEDVVHVLRKQC